MDSFEFTKIAGAVLSALLLIFATKTIIESQQGQTPEKPGYTIAVTETAPAPAAGGEATPGTATEEKAAAGGSGPAAVVAALAKANADSGKGLFNKCKACHAIEKGKPKGVGPNLWGVVNRPKASFEGFEYSPGMKEKGGNWTFEDLATFLTNPKAYVTGTKMVFAGFPNPADAADIIAYLASQSDTPAALPK